MNTFKIKTFIQSQAIQPAHKEISIAIKVTAMIILLIAAVSLTTNYILFTKSFHALEHEISNHLKLTAANAAQLMDPEMLQTIKTPVDEQGANYKTLQRRLQDFQRASKGKLRYVYTIAKNGNSYVYQIDAVPNRDRENHSPVGARFPIEHYPAALAAFRRPTAESKPILDTEFGGYSQSGYAPIYDTHHRVIGVIGVDMDVTTVNDDKKAMFQAAGAAAFVGLFLALLLGFLCSRYLTKPIFLLIRGTESIAAGKLETTVTVNRNDEYGRLAKAFNHMAASLKTSQNNLLQHQLQLEKKVARRTQELARINQEIQDILDHIGQAILTVDHNLQLNAEHSRFAEQLFGRTNFSGIHLMELLFPSGPSEGRSQLESWLKMVFHNTIMTWEDLLPIQPIDEICLSRNSDSDVFIRLHFVPIQENAESIGSNELNKVMVIIEDITEARQLTQQMEEKEQEYQDNINQIIELIQMDQSFFAEFVQECRDHLTDMEPQIRALAENPLNSEAIDELFRSIHTIKGNAGMFNLGKIAGKANHIEALLATMHTGDLFQTEQLIAAIDAFHSDCGETLRFYERILYEKTLDTGRTRTRQRIEKEYIKVKADGLQRLSNLLYQAASLSSVSDSLVQLMTEARVEINSMGLVPLSRIFGRLPRIVQDISQDLGKKAKLVIQGDDIEIESEHFDAIADSIIHLLRNAIDHGIEPPVERRAKGKPEEGMITLSINDTGSTLEIGIEDDGRGLDIEAIKNTAVQKGLIGSETMHRMADDKAMALIFTPGFTTNRTVTKISGRGVGMDIIKNNIESVLEGSIHLENKKDNGLFVKMIIPVKCRCGEVQNGENYDR